MQPNGTIQRNKRIEREGNLYVFSFIIPFYSSLSTIYIYICYIDMYFLHYGWQCEQAVYPRCSASDLEIDIELFLRYLQPAA